METVYVERQGGRWRARWYSRDEQRYVAVALPPVSVGGYSFPPRLPEDYPHVKRALTRQGFRVVRLDER